jgi:lycopene cyclase domain-containing protein
MLPAASEYAFVLLLYAATGLALTWDGVVIALRRPQFWPTLLTFFTLCMLIEVVALNAGWWRFDEDQVLGLYLWKIPIEEMALFVAFCVMVLATWEMLNVDGD